MRGCRKILIAVNGSMEVLEKGFELADDEKCWITVLKVIPTYEGELDLTGVKKISDVFDSDTAQARSAIEEAARKAGELVKIRIEEGDISETISRLASEERCDLVVLGRRRRKGFLGRLLGDGVVEKVSGSAPCPVLVVDAASVSAATTSV